MTAIWQPLQGFERPKLARMAPFRIGHSLEDRLGSVVALVKKEFSCGSYRQSRNSSRI
jgi:hypothetical protein